MQNFQILYYFIFLINCEFAFNSYYELIENFIMDLKHYNILYSQLQEYS